MLVIIECLKKSPLVLDLTAIYNKVIKEFPNKGYKYNEVYLNDILDEFYMNESYYLDGTVNLKDVVVDEDLLNEIYNKFADMCEKKLIPKDGRN